MQLCEAVKLKPVLPWKLQDVGNDQTVKYLPRKADNREQKQPKRRKCVAVNKAQLSW